MDSGKIKSFCIISHIDAGKSTLADRFLELAGSVSSQKMRPQYLDSMDLERERGITIKLQPVRLKFQFPAPNTQHSKFNTYYLNLVDTPGHVDFSYEVSRSLAAVEGALLLVDASKGVQAQTLANLELAQNQGIVLIPVVNKIDLPQAEVEETSKELADLLGISEDEVIKISAREGINIKQVLESVIKKVPSAGRNTDKPFRALVFDSKYDLYKGIIAYVKVVDGQIEEGEKIKFFQTENKGEVKELGFFVPEFSPQKKLSAGEIGYIATGIKETGKRRVGDTIIKLKVKSFTPLDTKLSNGASMSNVEPLPGYKEPKPMVFSSLYPENPDEFDLLKEALGKLQLNDPSLVFEPETKEALGRGFRCGFLGTLHAEIIIERLKREFSLNLVISSPSVVYKVINEKGEEKEIFSANDWPDPSKIEKAKEPWFSLEIITPVRFIGQVLEIANSLDGSYLETRYLGAEKAIVIYETPLREIISNLYDRIKSATEGFASMNYKLLGYKEADLIKMEILIAGRKEEAFSKIVPSHKAFIEGKNLVKKLKEHLPAQQFSVALQAVIRGKIIARETIRARRKDVTAPLYGGDFSRKRKLLEIQKKGKKELKEKGKVRIPSQVFLKVFRG